MSEGERWLLIGASSRGAAEDYAARRGIHAVLVLDRRDLLAPPWRLRARISGAEIDCAAIHSVDWTRERAPQLAELALGIAPARRRMVIDENAGVSDHRGRLLAVKAAARLPFELIGAGAVAGRQALRLLGPSPARPVTFRGSSHPDRVLAIWPGSSGKVGGAVTHMSGILEGFRAAGIQVGLASADPVGEQLAEAADYVEVAAPASRSCRLSKDTEQLATTRTLMSAARRLAASFKPDFVYQRHRAFFETGARLSADLDVPLILEWNASEAWMRRNWDRPVLTVPLLERLVASSERRILSASTVVAAVSTQAAEMAIEAGAVPDRIRVLPNGVDIARVDAALGRTADQAREGNLIGWVGSFGPWHGALVLIQAMRLLPGDIRLRMIGDGPERTEVQALAAELDVDDRIEWLGALPHGNALASLAQCDVLASPHVSAADSSFFGSPTKLFEYMALGRPIVASRLEQIGEVLEHGRTALLVEPGNARELATAIAEILDRPDRGAELGRTAAKEARDLHSWDRRAADLLNGLRGST